MELCKWKQHNVQFFLQWLCFPRSGLPQYKTWSAEGGVQEQQSPTYLCKFQWTHKHKKIHSGSDQTPTQSLILFTTSQPTTSEKPMTKVSVPEHPLSHGPQQLIYRGSGCKKKVYLHWGAHSPPLDCLQASCHQIQGQPPKIQRPSNCLTAALFSSHPAPLGLELGLEGLQTGRWRNREHGMKAEVAYGSPTAFKYFRCNAALQSFILCSTASAFLCVISLQ